MSDLPSPLGDMTPLERNFQFSPLRKLKPLGVTPMRVELELAGIRHIVADQKSAPTSKASSPKKGDGSGVTSRKSRNLMPLIQMNNSA